jgi:hypothetical protein
MRTGAHAINTWCRLRRSNFRFFVHPPPAIVATAGERGLRLVHEHRGHLWQVAALERGSAAERALP